MTGVQTCALPISPYLRARALLAEGRYREVLALGLEGTEGRLLRALALERLGRLEEALALARGLPLDREVRLLLGRLYLELGRPLEVWADWLSDEDLKG